MPASQLEIAYNLLDYIGITKTKSLIFSKNYHMSIINALLSKHSSEIVAKSDETLYLRKGKMERYKAKIYCKLGDSGIEKKEGVKYK